MGSPKPSPFQKAKGENWENVRPDLRDWAFAFTTRLEVDVEEERIRAFAPVFSPRRAPMDRVEWDILLSLQALGKRRHGFVVEARAEAAERKKARQACDVNYTEGPRSVEAVCQESGDAAESYGHGPRSLARSLVILSKTCSCGAGWHEEAA